MALSHLSAAGITDVGAKRKNNEDSIVLLPDYGIYCVADGMGGAQGGEVASAEVVSQVESSFAGLPLPAAVSSINGRGKMVVRALNRASRVVKKYSEERGISGTGSTAVVLAFDEKDPTRAMVLHAGDSRAYRLRDRTLVQLSADHTVAAAAGITDDNDLPPMFRGVVTRAVGVKAKVEVERTPLEVRPGDLYLLASDGLDKMVSDARMAEIMLAHPVDQLQAMAKALVDEANKCGGVDNVSVVIVYVGLNAPVEAYRYTKADEDAEAALIGEDADTGLEAPESESTETGVGRGGGEAGAEEELTPSRTGAAKVVRKAPPKAAAAKRPWWSRLLDLPTYLQIGLPLGIAGLVIAAMLMGRPKPEDPSAWAQYDELAPPVKGASAETPKTEPAESEEDVAARILSRLEDEEAPDSTKGTPKPDAEDAARLESERKAQEEAAQVKAQQEKDRVEAERKAAEDKARLEAEGKAAEEKARLEAERKAQEAAAQFKAQQEKDRVEAERRAAEDKARLEAEGKAQEEAAQVKAQQEKDRVEAERKAAEEKARLEAEGKAQQEKDRVEAERKVAEEKARMEAERKTQEEAAQVKAQQEKDRVEAQRKAAEEKARLEAERKTQEEAAQVKAQQEKDRVEAERKAAEEKARLESERKAQEEAARVKAAEEKARLDASQSATRVRADYASAVKSARSSGKWGALQERMTEWASVVPDLAAQPDESANVKAWVKEWTEARKVAASLGERLAETHRAVVELHGAAPILGPAPAAPAVDWPEAGTDRADRYCAELATLEKGFFDAVRNVTDPQAEQAAVLGPQPLRTLEAVWGFAGLSEMEQLVALAEDADRSRDLLLPSSSGWRPAPGFPSGRTNSARRPSPAWSKRRIAPTVFGERCSKPWSMWRRRSATGVDLKTSRVSRCLRRSRRCTTMRCWPARAMARICAPGA